MLLSILLTHFKICHYIISIYKRPFTLTMLNIKSGFLKSNLNDRICGLRIFLNLSFASKSNPQLGAFLDNTIVNLAKISSSCEIFADRCVLHGFVPPHPGDLQRALNNTDWKLQASGNAEEADATGLIGSAGPIDLSSQIDKIIGDDGRASSDIDENQFSKMNLPDISQKDRDMIKSFVEKSKNKLSQYTINRIHETVSNVPTRDIRNYIRILISRGEISQE